MEVFNEKKLRSELVNTWGECGVHVAVFDRMAKKTEINKDLFNVLSQIERKLVHGVPIPLWLIKEATKTIKKAIE